MAAELRAQPAAPTDPTAPTDPAVPMNPTAPTNPTVPTDPAVPMNPAAPTDPTDPSDPMDPTAPTNPTAPTDPTDPMNPAAPTNPTVPTDPTVPMNPTAPVDPMARRRKSRKKEKEKLAVVEEAEEGGNGAEGQAAEVKGQAAEIEGLTQAGHRALGLRDVRGALACFRKAFLLSLGTTSPRLRRVCAFNLGAAYVEAGKPRKGLKFLLESQPVEGEPFGGLYFNIGAAGEGLRDFPKALECFGQAAGPCRAGSQAVEMGCCYLGMQEPARAARCFLEAAQSYVVAESPEAAAVALSRASGSMLQSRRFGVAEIARILTWCRSLCDSIADPTLRGKLYNEVGLGFSQLHVFSLASESFERALALCQGSLGRRGEAALLQNLGAARNALRSFGTALGLHRRAAELHGTVGNRRAQGQCFGNLAYAFSQLGNHEAAAENYLHALQAFRDSGDVQGQWQACEGLGAARFHLGNPQKAVGHYQEALTLLSRCRGTPRAAGERIVSQLTRALQHQLCLHRHPSYWGAPAPDLNLPQFCSVLPCASGTRLRGSEASFREKAGDELHQPALGTQPGMPGAAAPAPDPATEPQAPRRHPASSEEDEDGPSTSPGRHSQPHVNGHLNSTRLRPGGACRSKTQAPMPPAAVFTPRFTRHSKHKPLGPRSPQRIWGPGRGSGMLSRICSLL